MNFSKFCFIKIINVVFLLLMNNSLALAQTKSSVQSKEMSVLFACQFEKNASKRLECFDKAVNRLQQAKNQGEIITITKNQIKEVEKNSFGFNIPSLPKISNIFKTGKDDTNLHSQPIEKEASENEENLSQKLTNQEKKTKETGSIKKVKYDIKNIQTFGYKKKRIFLQNGQVWEQTGSRDIRIPKVRNGFANQAHITEASLGSFLLRVNGRGTAIRVKRVR